VVDGTIEHMRHLTIVVPYRAREAHFKQFVAHLKAFFTRDRMHREIPYRVLIIEQGQGLPFNAGALRNIGFVLAREEGEKLGFDAGYTCFHDIDYLPLSADYRGTDVPTPIAWYGAEKRPVASGASQWRVANSAHAFFGAVVLTPNKMFARVNGYSNAYWGWGWQDLDLKARYLAAGIAPGRRRGTFLPLDHDNRGFTLDGKPAPISIVNQRLYEEKWAAGGRTDNDGLSNLPFDILDRREIDIAIHTERPASWEMVTVRLHMQPLPEQLDALATIR
jgi:hypothetical protein